MEDEIEPKSETPRKTTMKQKYQSLMENITIEPVLVCSTIPIALSRLATQNLNLDKACRVNLKYGDEICDALVARKGDVYKTEEAAVQEIISGMEIWQSVLYRAVPCFLILFVGAWSDRTGKRKICILLPIVGDLLACISNIINTYFFYELPLELCMFMEAFFPSLAGGWITMYMGAFSYIGDVSSEETRTFRVGIVNLCFTAGGPIGMALSGVLLQKIGYYGVFSSSSILYVFSILYGIYYIEDPKLPRTGKVVEEKGFLKTFFDLKHAKDTVTVAFKKGPNQRRTKAIMVLAGIVFVDGPAFGDMTIRYLYSRYRFNWDAVAYSFYKTFYIIMHALGALVSVAIFSRKFKWDDSVLGLISTISKIAGALVTGLAQNSLHMYLAVVIETFNASSFTALRSISSKLAATDELGKMTSMFNLTEVITSLNFGALFSWMYMMTLKFNPSFAYYVSAGITVVAVFIFGWFYKVRKESVKEQKSIDIDNCEDNKDKNDQWIRNAKKIEDPVTCNIELTEEKIIRM
ncbi:proton-coupled folate transporter-like [Hyposmocoma kahamanoa]|uniref:proton-coupled folate transporter-like n=1 Tax=Hyposmocoma kahamanoa TaxID=1477025 RepID=UPI000E6D746F|nr:proton-coupled folate transporter-like [Hyposmocoma kahamanoa]